MPKADEDLEYLEAWRKLKGDHPEIYTAAAIAPVSGQLIAVADYADAMDRRSTVDGITAAASLIPGFRLAKAASGLAPASIRLKSKMSPTEKAVAPVVRRAPAIGKVAAAQQVGEYAGEKTSPDDEVPADPDSEYLEAWGREDRRDSSTPSLRKSTD